MQVNFGALATALGKGAIAGAFGVWSEAASSGVDVLTALGIQGNKVEAVAWMLVQRSLLQGMSDLTIECKNELNTDKTPDFNLLCGQLDLALEKSELSLTPSFFTKPKDLPVVEKVKEPFRQWLQTCGLPQEQAQSLSDRLTRYFVFALNEQWRAHPTDYAPLQEALSGPFESANERELSWMRYGAWLQRRVDEPMFAEAFSLRQVYIPLRAYYEVYEVKVSAWKSLLIQPIKKATTTRNEQPLRYVVDLESAITDWLDQGDKDDAIRVICGGPGCGKSSFGRMLAAHLAEAQTLPVLFIPLHLFDPSGDLVASLNNFLRADLDNILPPNPLEKENAERKILLIFDGLDELSMQGKVGAQVAQDFVREVQKKLLSFNRNEARVFTLLSGRELVVQATKTEFRQEGQILYVLPYFQSEEEIEKCAYAGGQDLLQQDQRQVWWQTYGRLKSKEYTQLPRELNQGKLIEITAQPLLNYLVALSYDRGEVNFSTESNLNTIYKDLLKQVYKRDWAGYQHPTLGKIERKDFIRILEEIAIACWHGNGRTTTINTIEKRCASGSLKRILGIFEGGAKEGVTRLLTAFYFRQSGVQGSEATFEFTHKSFGEYLTARRIVVEITLMQQELERHKEEPDIGWDEKECLKRWVMLCGLTVIDNYLLSFLRDEVKLYPNEQVKHWQLTLSTLVSYMLCHGMPMEDLSPRPKFVEEVEQARNASEALLAALSSCAWVTQEVSKIDWPNPQSFGAWLATIQWQRVGSDNPITFNCLNHLDLNQCTFLIYQDLSGASLDGANLNEANLIKANLIKASLDGANLKGANLNEARLNEASLDGVNLDGANLNEASLDGACLDGANLNEANLNGASLEEASLEEACLDRANLDGANLNGANLGGASLEKASLKVVNLDKATLDKATLDKADLKEAQLNEASLEEASLKRTNFKNANLNGANLDRTNLNEAYLDGACLDEATLFKATLVEAYLDTTSLNGANLNGACLEEAFLNGAYLDRASLEEATLDRASLDGASLVEASLEEASLKEATLDGTSLNGTKLGEANLDRASLKEANLYRASLYQASLNGANLDRASMEEVSLDGASLEEASLNGASLVGASLDGANLDGVSLTGANLSKISWNDETFLANITGIETAKNFPEALKEQFGLE